MAWTLKRASSWPDLRQLLIEIGGHGGLSCHGDPKGRDELMSSIDYVFREASTPLAVRYSLEQIALERFLGQAMTHLPASQFDYLDDPVSALILMRHHGGPTRLLDWSESVWIAAYFAVRFDHSDDASIWVFDRYALTASVGAKFPAQTKYAVESRPGRASYPGVFFPDDPFPKLEPWVVWLYRGVNKFPRLVAQQGHFTIASRLGLDHGPLIDDLLSTPQPDDPPAYPHTRIQISKAAKADAMHALERMGITGASMFPGIDGVCGHISELMRFGHLDRGVQRWSR